MVLAGLNWSLSQGWTGVYNLNILQRRAQTFQQNFIAYIHF